MNRTEFSEVDLLAWLNTELEKNDDHNSCVFTSISRLIGKDEIGCNWANANIRCSGTRAAAVQRDATKIVDKARNLFDLK